MQAETTIGRFKKVMPIDKLWFDHLVVKLISVGKKFIV